eukprot:gene27340-14161_t
MFLLGYLVFGFGTLCACYYTCSIKYGNEFGLVDYLNQFRGCGKTEFFYTPLELGPTVFIFTILYGLALGLFVFGFYGVDLDQFWISACSGVNGKKLGASTRDSRGIKPGYTNHTVYGKILTVIDYTIYEETAAGTAAAHFMAVLMILLSAFPITFFGFAYMRASWRNSRKAPKAHEAKADITEAWLNKHALHGQECLEREAEAQLKAGSEMKK